MLVNRKQRINDLNLKAAILVYFNVLMKASFIVDSVFIAASDEKTVLNFKKSFGNGRNIFFRPLSLT
jgi:hypothetical protein